jgi:hypothetical protein
MRGIEPDTEAAVYTRRSAIAMLRALPYLPSRRCMPVPNTAQQDVEAREMDPSKAEKKSRAAPEL